MRLGDQLRACADCGVVLPIAHLSFTCDRPLCALCYQAETSWIKRDAEVWLLEQMFLLRPASPIEKLRMATATLRRRGEQH